jgi:hypothetical protein
MDFLHSVHQKIRQRYTPKYTHVETRAMQYKILKMHLIICKIIQSEEESDGEGEGEGNGEVVGGRVVKR